MKDAVRRSDMGKTFGRIVYIGVWNYCYCTIYRVRPKKCVLDARVNLKL